MELIQFLALALLRARHCSAHSGHPINLLASVLVFRPIQLPLSALLFLQLLLVVAALRIVELRISKRHQKDMKAQGAAKAKDPIFPVMAMFHTLVLIGAAVEVVFLHRPFLPALAIPMIALFVLANMVRWWVIRTLGQHWNVEVMDSTRLGVITTGPFRYVRHPNYAAVFVEMIALPLIHTAWITALVGAIAHIAVLSVRLSAEERVLFADPAYSTAMSSKPRFFPGLF
jgi:methyltransferase